MSTATTGNTGRGSTVAYSLTLTGSIVYTPLATVISVDGPGITVGEVDDTLLSSTFKPYVSTLPEGEGSLTVRHNSSDVGIIEFRSLVKAAPVPVLAWEITYQDGAIDTFLAFPKGYKVTGVQNETRVTATIDLRLTTAITSVAGTN
jgi:hypothetical protein